LVLENPDKSVPADIDAIILYPAISYATYTLPGGGSAKALRDSLSGALAVGAAAQVDGRQTILLDSPTAAMVAGSALRLAGTVTQTSGGTPVAGENVTVSALGGSASVKTDAGGRFSAVLGIPAATVPGAYRAKASTASGEASVGFDVIRSSGNGSSGGSVGGGGGSPVSEPNADGKLEVTKTDLIPRQGGGYRISIPEGTNKIRIPQRLLEDLASDPIEFAGQGIGLTFPSGFAADLIEQARTAGMKDWALDLEVVRLTAQGADAMLKDTAPSVNAKLNRGSDFYELKLSFSRPDGEALPIRTFGKPVRIVLQSGMDVNPIWSGIYYLDGRSLEYKGGRSEPGRLVAAELNHFSAYGVLEYIRAFRDVPSSHWAYSEITELAARRIVNGVSEADFGKNLAISRAEMTSLLVRALGIKGGDVPEIGFADVDARSWYAKDVAAAVEAGIVSGRSKERFAPAETITRAELAAILLRALKRTEVQVPTGARATADFADQSDIPDLFANSLAQAVGAGLLKGDDRNRLRPNDKLTRAEAAIVLVKLMDIAKLR